MDGSSEALTIRVGMIHLRLKIYLGVHVQLFIAFFLATVAATGAQITLPSKSFERSGTVVATYKTNYLATGTGELTEA